MSMFGTNRGVWPAWLIMFVLSLLLGWLPLVGPAIAGFVGGMQAGSTGSAIVAALVPAIVVSAFVWLLGAVLDIAILATLLGIGVFMVLVVGALPLLVGAFAGGWMAEARRSSSDVTR
jgi:hypothetical protein